MTEQQWARIVAALVAVVGALFLFRFRPAFLLLSTTARAAAIAAIVVIAAIGAGVIAIRLTRRVFAQTDDSISAPDALLIGFVVLGTLLGAIAWIGVNVAVVAVVVAILAAACVLGHKPLRFEPPPLTIALAIPLLFAVVEAITPVNSPDELVYKLATAHSYELYGRMIELPLASHSYLAMALQLGDLAALILGGGIAAKLVHLALYVATLIVIRRITTDFGLAVIAWTPALMIIAGFAWSEWPLIGLLILSYERWRASDHGVAYAALGCAVACKYNALVWLLVGGIVMLVRDRRLIARIALVVFAFGAFFYIRNAVWTGSPVAPLLLPDAPALLGWDLLHGAPIFDAQLADESLGIVLPVLALFGFFAIKNDLAKIGVAQLPLLLVMAPVPRNLLPSIVPLAIAGAAFVPRNRWVTILSSIAFAAQAVLVIFVLHSFDAVPYLAGSETQSQYIARVRDFARPYAFIASTTSPRARVLLLGENRTYYLERESIAASNNDSPRIAHWLARFPTPDALANEWRRMGITHVALHKPWYRIASPQHTLQPIEREYVLEVTPEIDRVVTETLKTRAVLRYRDEAYLVFELRP